MGKNQEKKNQQEHKEMTGMMALAAKGLNTAIINMLKHLKDNMNIMKETM